MTDRGVSVTANYVLNIAVATVLIGVILTTTSLVIDDRREQTVRSELRVIGERTATALMTADRLADGSGSEVTIKTNQPTLVAGSTYLISVNASASESYITVESDDPEVSVQVTFANHTSVENTTVAGGDTEIALATDGELEVRRA